MKRCSLLFLLLATVGCGPGLRSNFDDAGTRPDVDGGHQVLPADGGKDGGVPDAGDESDGGADAGDAGARCQDATQCPAAPDGGTAVCRSGTCGFACDAPLLPCGEVCCSAVAVTAGFEHSCVLTDLGGVKCWGGWTALGGFEDRLQPADVPGLSQGVIGISAGYFHTCALMESGVLRCWGLNGNGSLGDGTPGPKYTPIVPVGMDGGVTAFVAGAHHTCAVRDGALLCWGSNVFGELGDNTTTARNTPGAVSGMAQGVVDVSAGTSHSCALVADGGVYCWGANLAGQTGDGTTTQKHLTPVEAVAVTHADAGGIADVQLGFTHSCALMSTGAVRCFGQNGEGQAGDGTASSPKRTSVEVAGLDGGVQVLAAGSTSNHSCVVKDGSVWCWGQNTKGQLGDTTVVTPRRTPVETFGVGEARSVAPGGAHTCAVTAAGGVKCWGLNDRGQLGDGTRTDRWAPVDVRW